MQCNSGIVAFSFAQISKAMPNGGYGTVKSAFTGHFRQYIDDKNNKKGAEFSVPFCLINFNPTLQHYSIYCTNFFSNANRVVKFNTAVLHISKVSNKSGS